MAKKTKMSPEDIAAFHKAVEGVRPLIQRKIRLQPLASHSKKTTRVAATEDFFHFSEAQDLDLVQGEEYIAYKGSGISNKILRKLGKGQYNVEAILDLHGMSVEAAEKAVSRFLQQCLHEGRRVVLIIHGKGRHKQMPILKNKLNHWLRTITVVLAFCSAAHNNRGAIYVLLKRTMEDDT